LIRQPILARVPQPVSMSLDFQVSRFTHLFWFCRKLFKATNELCQSRCLKHSLSAKSFAMNFICDTLLPWLIPFTCLLRIIAIASIPRKVLLAVKGSVRLRRSME